MAEETQQDGQKTLVAFVVGLLIGGMLVWAFSGPTADAPKETMNDEETEEREEMEEGNENESVKETEEAEITEEEVPVLQVGNGEVSVLDQPAGATIALDSAVYPVSEGWIGVREYNNDKLGYILGVARFSEEQGLIPSEISLLRSTTAGNRYAIVIFSEDGDRTFNSAGDVQIDEIFDTFVAQ